MTISVVISTLRRLPELERCLDSLRRQSRPPEELLLIDAAADPQVERLARARAGSFSKLLYFPLPSSLTQARNHGVRESTGEIVVFLDDDLVLEPDFLAEIARPLEEDPGRRLAGVTGDILNHPRGAKPWLQAFKILFQLPCDGDGRFRLSGAPTMAHGLKSAREVEFLPGGATAWRREIFRDFRFDDGLPGLGVNEDVDFSYRVSRKWRNAYAPKARVTHLRPPLEREVRLDYLRQELGSAWYLYRKNLPKDPLHFSAFLWHQFGVVARFLFRRFLRQ